MEKQTLFKNFSNVKLMQPGKIRSSIVVAPHPDDETLGCGGTAALLLRKGYHVHFLFVSDGTMSHPNSEKFPAETLRELRESEARKAVKILGADENDAEFLALPDRHVPDKESSYFESAVRTALNIIAEQKAETIFVPWQNDPHPDHKATWQILTEAVNRLPVRPRLLQYPIWFWEMGNETDRTLIEKMKKWRVDIKQTIDVKRKALLAHESQVTDLIDDDPEGFRLSEQVISHFDTTSEIFFES